MRRAFSNELVTEIADLNKIQAVSPLIVRGRSRYSLRSGLDQSIHHGIKKALKNSRVHGPTIRLPRRPKLSVIRHLGKPLPDHLFQTVVLDVPQTRGLVSIRMSANDPAL